jgi:hypothetical protein
MQALSLTDGPVVESGSSVDVESLHGLRRTVVRSTDIPGEASFEVQRIARYQRTVEPDELAARRDDRRLPEPVPHAVESVAKCLPATVGVMIRPE